MQLVGLKVVAMGQMLTVFYGTRICRVLTTLYVVFCGFRVYFFLLILQIRNIRIIAV